MKIDSEQHMVVVKKALADIEEANGGITPATMADSRAVHPQAFSLLIEALVALEPITGSKVGDDLVAMAGLVPVDQAVS
jgi:hypothetical protein